MPSYMSTFSMAKWHGEIVCYMDNERNIVNCCMQNSLIKNSHNRESRLLSCRRMTSNLLCIDDVTNFDLRTKNPRSAPE